MNYRRLIVAQIAIGSDAEQVLKMCQNTADIYQVDLYWVIEEFIKEFFRRAQDA